MAQALVKKRGTRKKKEIPVDVAAAQSVMTELNEAFAKVNIHLTSVRFECTYCGASVSRQWGKFDRMLYDHVTKVHPKVKEIKNIIDGLRSEGLAPLEFEGMSRWHRRSMPNIGMVPSGYRHYFEEHETLWSAKGHSCSVSTALWFRSPYKTLSSQEMVDYAAYVVDDKHTQWSHPDAKKWIEVLIKLVAVKSAKQAKSIIGVSMLKAK